MSEKIQQKENELAELQKKLRDLENTRGAKLDEMKREMDEIRNNSLSNNQSYEANSVLELDENSDTITKQPFSDSEQVEKDILTNNKPQEGNNMSEEELLRAEEVSDSEQIITGTVEDERVGPLLDQQNIGFWEKMSARGKQIISGAYEGIYKTPGVNRLVGKMEIAYNQFWIDKKENKNIELKGKLDALDLRNQAIESTKEQMMQTADMLRDGGIPGANNIELRSKKLENKQNKIEAKSNKLQNKIEKRENRIKLFTNKRDAVADKLIAHYEKKLSPIEGKLEVLEDNQNKVELGCISSEIKLGQLQEQLKALEAQKIRIEKSLTSNGFSERQTQKNEAVKELGRLINARYTNIQIENARIVERRRQVNERVAKIDKKVAPYRNRKDEFIRIKDNRPLKIDLEERNYPPEFKSTENVTPHPRSDSEDRYYTESERTSSNARMETSYAGFENNEDLSVVTAKFNRFISSSRAEVSLLVDPNDFSSATNFPGNRSISIKDFKRLLEQYYKIKRIPQQHYSKIINNFK